MQQTVQCFFSYKLTYIWIQFFLLNIIIIINWNNLWFVCFQCGVLAGTHMCMHALHLRVAMMIVYIYVLRFFCWLNICSSRPSSNHPSAFYFCQFLNNFICLVNKKLFLKHTFNFITPISCQSHSLITVTIHNQHQQRTTRFSECNSAFIHFSPCWLDRTCMCYISTQRIVVI